MARGVSGLTVRENGRGWFGCGLLHNPGGEGAVCVAAHELLPLVVPADRPQGLGGLVAAVCHASLEIPNHQLARLKRDQKLQEAQPPQHEYSLSQVYGCSVTRDGKTMLF